MSWKAGCIYAIILWMQASMESILQNTLNLCFTLAKFPLHQLSDSHSQTDTKKACVSQTTCIGLFQGVLDRVEFSQSRLYDYTLLQCKSWRAGWRCSKKGRSFVADQHFEEAVGVIRHLQFCGLHVCALCGTYQGRSTDCSAHLTRVIKLIYEDIFQISSSQDAMRKYSRVNSSLLPK